MHASNKVLITFSPWIFPICSTLTPWIWRADYIYNLYLKFHWLRAKTESVFINERYKNILRSFPVGFYKSKLHCGYLASEKTCPGIIRHIWWHIAMYVSHLNQHLNIFNFNGPAFCSIKSQTPRIKTTTRKPQDQMWNLSPECVTGFSTHPRLAVAELIHPSNSSSNIWHFQTSGTVLDSVTNRAN